MERPDQAYGPLKAPLCSSLTRLDGPWAPPRALAGSFVIVGLLVIFPRRRAALFPEASLLFNGSVNGSVRRVIQCRKSRGCSSKVHSLFLAVVFVALEEQL